LIALADVLTAQSKQQRVARHGGDYYTLAQFQSSVAEWSTQLQRQPVSAYALYCDHTYPFAVLLFALLHAGKPVWIPGNNRPGTAQQLQQLGCRLIGDWPAHFLDQWAAKPVVPSALSNLNQQQAQLVIFTSGSTGAAKPVCKSLSQLQAEIDTLESLWGPGLADSQVLATVSHQHIYGLLFRLLWPLAAGRCFVSETALSPEALLKQADKACWVASPAQLKRLDQTAPWADLAGLTAIFSSGGPLPLPTAEQLKNRCGQAVIEIYGSSETGGIAWRQQPEQAWRLFDGLRLTDVGDAVRLDSPYLPEDTAYRLDDALSLLDDGRFLLQGRNDRIVKVEEKRLSLSELEQRLRETGWIDEVWALLLEKQRDTVAVAAVLSSAGQHQLQMHGRNALIKQLKSTLQTWFDAVLLPRKWLFVQPLPLTTQGKPDNALLKQLLSGNSSKLPVLQGLVTKLNHAELQLKIAEDLAYFAVHFPDYPILPGVVQIGWAEHFGKILFPIRGFFAELEAIKFVKPIQPGCSLCLKLHWKADSGKLYFSFVAGEESYSFGRLVYRA